MKHEYKIHIEEWINDDLKICLDKYETNELFTELRLKEKLCDKDLNLPGQHMTEIETKIYEALKPVIESLDKKRAKGDR